MSDSRKKDIMQELTNFAENVRSLEEPLVAHLEGIPEWIQSDLIGGEFIHTCSTYGETVDRLAHHFLPKTESLMDGLQRMARLLRQEEKIHDQLNNFHKPLLEKLVEMNKQGHILEAEMTHVVALEYVWFADAVVMRYVDLLLRTNIPYESARDKIDRIKKIDRVVGKFVEKMYDRRLRNWISHAEYIVMESGALHVEGRLKLKKEDFVEKVTDLLILGRFFNSAVILASARFLRDEIVVPIQKGELEFKEKS